MVKSVWRRAAERVAEKPQSRGCCDALQEVMTGSPYGTFSAPCAAIRSFRAMFEPKIHGTYWWDWEAEDVTARIIALLLMDQIARNQ